MGRGLTQQRALEISHLKGHRGCRGGDGEVYKALGFQHLLMGGGPNMRIYPDGQAASGGFDTAARGAERRSGTPPIFFSPSQSCGEWMGVGPRGKKIKKKKKKEEGDGATIQ